MSPALAKNNALGHAKKSGMRILVVTGGSGGHIFPALAFLESLKEKYRDIDTLLVLPQGIRQKEIAVSWCDIAYLPFTGLGLGLSFKNIPAWFNFLKSVAASIFILADFRPEIVVGFGSLASLPMVIFAWLFRIHTVIHEQNVIAGRANRLLAIFADKIAVSFAESVKYFSFGKNKITFTGNPLRKTLVKIEQGEALSFLGLAKDKFTLLVMGGSQGSQRINAELVEALALMSGRSGIQVIHLAGIKDVQFLRDAYNDLGLGHKVFSFLAAMQYAYSAADLVVCRAGATTLAEILFYQLPAIIIPYPHAYGHQSANAAVLEEKGLARVIDEARLERGILKRYIEDFFSDSQLIKNMRQNYRNIALPEASELMLGLALSL